MREGVGRSILAALRGVIHRAGVIAEELRSITVPTLVIGRRRSRLLAG